MTRKITPPTASNHAPPTLTIVTGRRRAATSGQRLTITHRRPVTRGQMLETCAPATVRKSPPRLTREQLRTVRGRCAIAGVGPRPDPSGR